MSHLPGVAASSPPEEPSARNKDSGYFEAKAKHSPSKFMKPYSFYTKLPKPSWSTSDLSSAYRGALGALPLRPGRKPQPRKDFTDSKFFGRHSGVSKPNTPDSFEFGQNATPPTPPVLDPSLEASFRKFLKEKVCEQKEKRKPRLLPRARYVYGLWEEWPVIPDTSMEPHADYTVCARLPEEQATCATLHEQWAADKARGVHFPSVLKVRRKELTASLEESQKTYGEMTPRPWRRAQTEAPTPTKCSRCATDLMLVPEGLNASDWLPLMLLRRAQRCERQQRSRDEHLKARALVVSRALRPSEPRLAGWTNRGIKNFVPKPSPLTGRSKQRAVSAVHGLRVVSEVFGTSVISVEGEGTGTCIAGPETIDESDSPSEYSLETTSTGENSQPLPGVYREVEVSDLKWVKAFRVPNFSKQGNHSSLVGEITAGNKAVEAKQASSREKCDFNKPLPPLPSPPQVPLRRGIEHYRNLRRSQSAATAMLLGQKCSTVHDHEPGVETP